VKAAGQEYRRHWKNAAAANKINASGWLWQKPDNALVNAEAALNPCFAILICK
jgi:hypothetical protein